MHSILSLTFHPFDLTKAKQEALPEALSWTRERIWCMSDLQIRYVWLTLVDQRAKLNQKKMENSIMAYGLYFYEKKESKIWV